MVTIGGAESAPPRTSGCNISLSGVVVVVVVVVMVVVVMVVVVGVVVVVS